MAFNLGDIFVTFKARTEDLEQGVAKTRALVASTEAAVNGTSFRRFSSEASTAFDNVANGIQGVVTKLAIVAAASTYGGLKFVSLAGELQTTQQRMAALAGSTEDARRIMGELYTYVLGKPIAFPEASKAAQTLMGYGVAAKDVVAQMKVLSAFSIVNGADMGQLALAMGQVNAKGRLMGQEIIQLTNNFVPVSQVIAKHFKVPIQEAMELMDNGKISAAEFTQAMAEFIPQEKIAEQSNTFKNRLISLQGSIRAFGLALIGVKVDPQLGLVVEPGGLFDKLSNFLPKLADGLKRLKPVVAGAFQWLADNGDLVKSLIFGIGVAFVAAKVAAIGFGIASAFATGGLTLIIPLVVAAIGVLAALQAKFNFIGKTLEFLHPVLEIIGSVLSDLWHSMSDLAAVIGKELAPAFKFVSDHADFFKKVLVILVAVGLAPLIATVATIVGGLKLLAIGLEFVADHFDTIKNVIVTSLKIAFAPLYLAILGIQKIMDALGITWGDVWRTLVNIVTTSKDLIMRAINDIKTAPQAVIDQWNRLKDATEKTWNNIKDTISSSVDTVKTKFGEGVDAVKSKFGEIRQGMSDTFGDVKKALEPWKRDFGGTLLSTLTNARKDLDNYRRDTLNEWKTHWDAFSKTAGDRLSAIGDSFTNFFKTAKNKVVNGVKDMLDSFGDFFTSLPGKFSRTFDTIRDNVVDFFSKLPGRIKNSLESFGNAVVDTFKDLPGKVGGALEKFGNGVVDFFKDIPKKVKSALGSIGDFFKDMFSGGDADGVKKQGEKAAGNFVDGAKKGMTSIETIRKVGDAIVELIGAAILAAGVYLVDAGYRLVMKIGDGIASAFVFMFQKGTELVGNVISGIASWFGNLFNKGAEISGNTANGIGSFFSQIFGKGVELVSNVVNGIGSALGAVYNKGLEIAQNVVNAIANMLSAIWGKGSEITGNIVSGIASGIGSIIGIASSIIGTIIGVLAGGIGAAWNKGREIVSGLASGISAMAGSVYNAIKGASDQIGHFFAGAGSWLYGVGRAIFQGLINGMESIGSGVYNTAKSIMNKVRNLFPFSPAKEGPFSGKGWTAYSGSALVQGFADGITKTGAEAHSAINKVMSGVDDAINNVKNGQMLAAGMLGSFGNMIVNPNISPVLTPGGYAPTSGSVAATGQPAAGPLSKKIEVHGDINIDNPQDADYFFQRFDRDVQLENMGVSPSG